MRLLTALTFSACFIVFAQEPRKLPDITYNSNAPMDVQEKPVKDFRDCRLLDISFTSPRGGRVTAYAVTPVRRSRRNSSWTSGCRARWISGEPPTC
jgi:hypothetical protein